MNEQPAFPDPWWDLRPDGTAEHRQREALHAELLTEVAVGHPLHGLRAEVIGRSQASDDIVVQLATGGWARVHLTYERAPETPPWPGTTFSPHPEAPLQYQPERQFFRLSSPTARMITAPLMMSWVKNGTFISTSPLLRTPMMSAPMKVP